MALDGRRREAGQLGDRELGLGRAERVDGGRPAGAHHQGDVVGLGAGQLAQAGGGVGGGGVRVALDVSGITDAFTRTSVTGESLRA